MDKAVLPKIHSRSSWLQNGICFEYCGTFRQTDRRVAAALCVLTAWGHLSRDSSLNWIYLLEPCITDLLDGTTVCSTTR